MSRFLLFVVLVVAGCPSLRAQTTFRLTSVPVATPAGATIYLTGSFNNWGPGEAA